MNRKVNATIEFALLHLLSVCCFMLKEAYFHNAVKKEKLLSK